jgi:hypothetical protein
VRSELWIGTIGARRAWTVGGSAGAVLFLILLALDVL